MEVWGIWNIFFLLVYMNTGQWNLGNRMFRTDHHSNSKKNKSHKIYQETFAEFRFCIQVSGRTEKGCRVFSNTNLSYHVFAIKTMLMFGANFFLRFIAEPFLRVWAWAFNNKGLGRCISQWSYQVFSFRHFGLDERTRRGVQHVCLFSWLTSSLILRVTE